MNKTSLGIFLGAIAGVIDVIPMLFQGLSWDANFSAFSFWVVSGFLISRVKLKMNGAVKGILVSLLVLLPLAIIIGWQDPFYLIPILFMTLLLGSAVGFFVDKFGK